MSSKQTYRLTALRMNAHGLKQSMDVVDALSSTLIPSALQSMCSTSLQVIARASSDQLGTAVKYNQDKINTLLIQLLVVNFISSNQTAIENELELKTIITNNEANKLCTL